MSLDVTSTAFGANGPIPSEYTCDGDGSSPPLRWSEPPQGTKSIAILVEDPDAPRGIFTHWLVTNIPPSTTSLAQGWLPDGVQVSKNSAGTAGWTGPCPPSGRHRYVFHVYALDTTLPKPATREAFLASIQGHVLSEGTLVGTYARNGNKR